MLRRKFWTETFFRLPCYFIFITCVSSLFIGNSDCSLFCARKQTEAKSMIEVDVPTPINSREAFYLFIAYLFNWFNTFTDSRTMWDIICVKHRWIKHPVNISNKYTSIWKRNILVKLAYRWDNSYTVKTFWVGSLFGSWSNTWKNSLSWGVMEDLGQDALRVGIWVQWKGNFVFPSES